MMRATRAAPHLAGGTCQQAERGSPGTVPVVLFVPNVAPSRACMIVTVTPAGPVVQKGTDRMAFLGHQEDPALGIVPNATGDATRWCGTD